MPDYTYLWCDLMTNQVVDEVTPSEVELTKQLSGTGSWSGSFKVTRRNRDRLRSSLIPRRTALYVDRDGALVYGGILWDRDYNSENQTLRIGGGGFGSYLQRRAIDAEVDNPSIDSVVAARALITSMQAQTGSNLGIVLEGAETSGTQIDQLHEEWELKWYWDALSGLASLDSGGFDFHFDARYGPDGKPQRYVAFGHPRLGATGGELQVSYPGNIRRFSWPELGGDVATDVFGLGAGSGASAYIAHKDSPTALAQGFPRLDYVATYGDEQDEEAVEQLAAADLKARTDPPTVPPIEVRGDIDPVVGSYTVGDDLRMLIYDPWLELDTTRKITQLTLRPGGDGPETITIETEAA